MLGFKISNVLCVYCLFRLYFSCFSFCSFSAFLECYSILSYFICSRAFCNSFIQIHHAYIPLQLTNLRCIFQWFLYIQNCTNITTIDFRTIAFPPKETLHPLAMHDPSTPTPNLSPRQALDIEFGVDSSFLPRLPIHLKNIVSLLSGSVDAHEKHTVFWIVALL